MTEFDSAWALRPEVVDLVVGLVAGGRTSVIECGSGRSTVAIGGALRDLGPVGSVGSGHVHALEHGPEYAATTRAAVSEAGLEGFATVVDAPLEDGWYDLTALERLPRSGVDLLLVDGPPANEPELERSRYPALSRLSERLAPGAAIVLDDAKRDGERWVIERWEREHGLTFERRGDCAVAGWQH